MKIQRDTGDAEERWRRRDADGGKGGVIAGREEEGSLLLCVKIDPLLLCVMISTLYYGV